jgi:CDP-diacylglycerol---glycerol-3-phosphate 3-phosphatidyltransferase
MNWANFVTYTRIALIPVVVGFFFSDWESGNLVAAIVFTVASISDWLDGYLARKLNLTSDYGAFIDPVADKLLVAVVLIVLLAAYPALWIATSIIVGREILVSALREWMATRNKRDSVAVAFSGKVKTTIQMIAIALLLLGSPTTPEFIWQAGYILLNLAALVSLWSMIQYFRNAWSTLIQD